MPKEVGDRRILIVEDEAVVADTLRQILSSCGYDTHVAYSAETALSSLSRWSPDIAILDVMLPKMNGIDLAMALKEGFPECHILLISGQPAADGLLQNAGSKGHDFEILAKPVHPTEILDTIAALFSTNGCQPCNQD
ncbi:MAG TPA: response regulator [Terracidiphilus sp.]|nr:response regulator [Terracidiphilus sp.]